mmetsp:Transcript_10067/g.32361  ORF Transcript_10067/g.32361 Transcript_10067/m.32361 type:complete len:291 (-) Transcript_10067:8-880(-)
MRGGEALEVDGVGGEVGGVALRVDGVEEVLLPGGGEGVVLRFVFFVGGKVVVVRGGVGDGGGRLVDSEAILEVGVAALELVDPLLQSVDLALEDLLVLLGDDGLLLARRPFLAPDLRDGAPARREDLDVVAHRRLDLLAQREALRLGDRRHQHRRLLLHLLRQVPQHVPIPRHRLHREALVAPERVRRELHDRGVLRARLQHQLPVPPDRLRRVPQRRRVLHQRVQQVTPRRTALLVAPGLCRRHRSLFSPCRAEAERMPPLTAPPLGLVIICSGAPSERDASPTTTVTG